MSPSRRTSSLAASSLLPSYAAVSRQSGPPTYSEHVDSLSPPERAFIANQARLLDNGDGTVRYADAKASTSKASSNDLDIERSQRLVDNAERRNRQASNPQGNPTANAWRVFLTMVVLFALPAVFAALAAIPNSFPYSHKCSDKRQAKVKGTAIYFGIALGWLLFWSLLRTWKHKSRNRPRGPRAMFSIFWTWFIWIGYCVVVAFVWVKNVCMWL